MPFCTNEQAQASQSQTDVKGTSIGQMANRTASVPGLKPKHQTPHQILTAKEVCVLKRNDFTLGKLLSSCFKLHTCHMIINLFLLNFLIRRNDREN